MANLANENASYIDHLVFNNTDVPNGSNDIEVAISSKFTSAERAQIVDTMDTLSSYIEPDFDVTDDFASADLTWGEDNSTSSDGVFFASTSTITLNTDAGGFSPGLPMHELGHAMGLSHPGEVDNGSADWNGSGGTSDDSDSAITGPDGQNGLGTADTMMQGLVDGALSSNGNGGQDTLQWMDIQALQAMHGMETDSPARFTLDASDHNLVNFTDTGVGNETRVLGSSENSFYYVADGARVENDSGFDGTTEVYMPGELEEFVLVQDGTTLGLYDDDLTALQFGVGLTAADNPTLNFDNNSYEISVNSSNSIEVGGEEVGITGGSNGFGFEASDAIAV